MMTKGTDPISEELTLLGQNAWTSAPSARMIQAMTNNAANGPMLKFWMSTTIQQGIMFAMFRNVT